MCVASLFICPKCKTYECKKIVEKLNRILVATKCSLHLYVILQKKFLVGY